MQRRDLSAALIGVVGGAAILSSRAEAQSCSPLCYPLTAAEQTDPTKVVNTAYPPGNIERYKSAATGTDYTAAIQAALDLNEVVDIPGGEFLFTNLVWRFRRTIRGKGPRWSVLKQSSGANTAVAALTLESGGAPVVAPLTPPSAAGDISEGTYRADGVCVSVRSNIGIFIGASSRASVFMSDQFRLVSQLFNPSTYATSPGQTALKMAPDNADGSIFLANHRNLEIRGFDVGIWALGTPSWGGVNEWAIHGWFIDNRIAVRLNIVSTWNLNGLSVESHVAGARAYQLFNSISNLVITGGRWELTGADCYGIEGDGTVTGANIRIRDVNLLITGDTAALPGRKWSGVLPGDTLFEGSDGTSPFIIVPNQIATRMPNILKLGNPGFGNGRIEFGSNSPSGITSTIEHDGTDFQILGGGSVKIHGNAAATERLEITGNRAIFTGADGSSGHLYAVRFGATSYLWVDMNGKLRIKVGAAPVANLEGVVVGSQT